MRATTRRRRDDKRRDSHRRVGFIYASRAAATTPRLLARGMLDDGSRASRASRAGF